MINRTGKKDKTKTNSIYAEIYEYLYNKYWSKGGCFLTIIAQGNTWGTSKHFWQIL